MKQKNGSHCPFQPILTAVSAGIGHISLFWWPFWSESTVLACFDGRIGSRFRPNRLELAHFGPNRRESGRVSANWRESKKKKGRVGELDVGRRTPRWAASDFGTATLELCRCLLGYDQCQIQFFIKANDLFIVIIDMYPH